MEHLLSPVWEAVLNLAAVTLSLAAVGAVTVGYLQRRRQRYHDPAPAARAPFSAEMEIERITQRYAHSLEKIARLIDAERIMLASPAHPSGPNDTSFDPTGPSPHKTVSAAAAVTDDRQRVVRRMTTAVAEARQLLDDGLDPAAVSERVPVPREGLDLMAKVNAARLDSNPGGQ